ncbi:sensor histidine kinase [Novipirellula artificiosorum]|uniref:histidine kinase n=1 Tax=Novipirellula artificiosorum TaxID=2528016 RepID=A0A5C6DUC1_9BACT|nr:ATP-binding protein [Novipirellula artificiosorum]TWU40983.1 Signal transduction histidine-protein kinase BarA [Novipirellula artificiosorum]
MFRFIKGVFASMSLERKCLLFFGSAILVLMCAAFFVVQLLAKRLVTNTTRQRARDYAAEELYIIHSDAKWSAELPSETVTSNQESLNELRAELLTATIDFEVLALQDSMPYEKLPTIDQPETPHELELLKGLEPQYRSWLARQIGQDRPDVERPLDLGDNEAMSRIGLLGKTVFAEDGPIDDRYVFYYPVFFKPTCVLSCHHPVGREFSTSPDVDPMTLAEQYPYRVFRIRMPYQETADQTDMIRAIVIALAMAIITATLYVLHAIVRFLVLQPLYHLRDVSDAITHGDTNQRATIDTEDEFRELADAFNRMLRHLTETQDKIQEVNRELDARVDQFAQLNLQLYEANRLKSDFLANMSHELRTPLNSIIGFSEVLSGIDSLNDKQRRYASNIQKSGRLLLEMINDILDLAKVEAGKMELRRSEFDVGRLVSAQCDMIHSLSEEKNISLSVETAEDLPKSYQDQNKLGQIINNLLSNAIKFTPEGGMITVRVEDAGEGRFRLSVKDTGVGIAEEDQPIIFQKFRQSQKVLNNEGLTREFAGTGLGLSIVKELAKLLGGEVDFESELGRGSTFWVTLPWRLSDRAAAELPLGSPTVAGASPAELESLNPSKETATG